jgi:hypothetical protein
LKMDVTTWLPAMFILGMAALGLCCAFLRFCEKI